MSAPTRLSGVRGDCDDSGLRTPATRAQLTHRMDGRFRSSPARFSRTGSPSDPSRPQMTWSLRGFAQLVNVLQPLPK